MVKYHSLPPTTTDLNIRYNDCFFIKHTIFYIIGGWLFSFSSWSPSWGNEEQLKFIKSPFQIPTQATHSIPLIPMFAMMEAWEKL